MGLLVHLYLNITRMTNGKGKEERRRRKEKGGEEKGKGTGGWEREGQGKEGREGKRGRKKFVSLE